MVAGSGNFVDDMMRWAGIENLGAKFGGRYPRVDLDAVMAASPEVILLPDEPYLFEPRHSAEFENWPDVPAVRDGRILCLDGKALSWYGPRIAASLRYLRGRVGAS